ncbi:restriction endonuclease subunit S, partial [Lactobacillus sp. DCY120]|nr:restriction endonuclease subunit S [Bombilactobacillus apium]
ATMMNNLVTKDFLKQNLNIPQLSEQRRIGRFLSNIDQLIAVNQRKSHVTPPISLNIIF